MNEIQKKLYELLIKFDNLCRQFDITYYLGGGSALGALRHKGFLPWDDDVDLYITRKNYLKLVKHQNEIFDDDFKLVNYENYPHYGNTLVRCVDTHTTAITKARIVDGTPKGQFIELFILDPMPINKKEQEDWKKKHWIYAELLSFTYRVANVRISEYIDEDLYYYYVKKCEELGKDKVLSILEKELFTIDEKDAKEYCSRWGLRNLIYDIEWFQKPRYVPFEDIQLPVATYAENVLRFDYGDNWMYIPKVENQIVHSFAESMTISYHNFENDYLPFIDTDKIFDAYYKRKEYLMKVFFANLKNHRKREKLKEAQVIASIEYSLKDNNYLSDLFVSKQYNKIEVFFKQWYSNQFHRSFWSWGTFIPLNDNLLFYALLPLVMNGEYSKVRKILMMRGDKNISSELISMKKFVENIRNIYIAIDNHNIQYAYQLLLRLKNEEYSFDIEEQYDYSKLSIQLSIGNVSADQLYDLKKNCIHLLDKYPNDGEIISMYADILFNLGEKKECIKLYQEAFDKTQHGFVRMHINDQMKSLKGELND